jgi:hypothetical protein
MLGQADRGNDGIQRKYWVYGDQLYDDQAKASVALDFAPSTYSPATSE